MDPKEVKQKAKQVNDISMDYHLTNAIFACSRIVQSEFKEYIDEKSKVLKERLLAAENAGSIEKINEINKEIAQLKAPLWIHVEYISKGKGRVIFTPESNRFVITLPGDLLTETRKPDGTYNPEGLKKLRYLTAHEIGHIALQTKDLLNIESTQGTINLDGKKEAETDADIFAKELLALRHKRNEKLFKSGMWEAF